MGGVYCVVEAASSAAEVVSVAKEAAGVVFCEWLVPHRLNVCYNAPAEPGEQA